MAKGADAEREKARELQTRIHIEVESIEDLRELVRAELQHFDEHHAVSCLERLGSIGRDAETEERLLGALLQRLDSGQMEISTLARLGAAAVSISLSDVVSLVTAKASQKANEFGNRDMAVLVRAMAMAGQGAAVEALVNGAAPRAPGLGARALVRLAWASARVRWQSPALDIVLEEAAGRADRLQPQAMSNLLWSMASLRNRNKNALRTLLPHMVDRVRRLSPQGLATGLWALAALRPRAGKSVSRPGWLEEDAVLRMSTQAIRRIEAFSPEDLGALARVTAVFASAQTRGADFAPLAEAVVSEATKNSERLHNLPPRQLSRILGSMTRWRCRDQDSIERLTNEVARKAEQLNAEQTAAIIWASCALHVSTKLVPALSMQVSKLFQDRSERNTSAADFGSVAGLLWAASLSVKPGRSATWPRAYGSPESDWLNGSFLDMTNMELNASDAQTYQLAGVAVAGARLRLGDCSLLRATRQEIQKRAETGLEAQDCALAARGFATLGLHSEGLLGTLCHSFLQQVGRSFEGWDTGRDWSDMVEALLLAGTGSVLPGSFDAELISAYEDAVILPLLKHLEEIVASEGKTKALAQSLKSLERFAASLGLPGLGAEQSRQVLKRANLAEVAEISHPCWASAREAAAERLWSSNSIRSAWLSYNISLSLDDFQLEEQEPGRLVAVAGGHSEQVPGLLRPLALPGVSAAGRHAEHQAVLAVFSLLKAAQRRIQRRALTRASKDAKTRISGDVRIYAFGSTPCLSFLATLAQLKSHFPMIVLTVGFDEDVARIPRLPNASFGSKLQEAAA